MSKLLTPMKVGEAELSHRIAMAPLTRYRCDDDWVPLPMVTGANPLSSHHPSHIPDSLHYRVLHPTLLRTRHAHRKRSNHHRQTPRWPPQRPGHLVPSPDIRVARSHQCGPLERVSDLVPIMGSGASRACCGAGERGVETHVFVCCASKGGWHACACGDERGGDPGYD